VREESGAVAAAKAMGCQDYRGGARSTGWRGGRYRRGSEVDRPTGRGGQWWSVGAQFWHRGMRCGSACGGYHGGRGSSRGGKRRRVGQGRRQAS
jgi:hypothetical protein